MAELRAAIMTAPIGQSAADGHFLANLGSLFSPPTGLDRPGPRPADATGDRFQPDLAAAIATREELGTIAPLPLDLTGAVAGDIAARATPLPQDSAENLADADTARDVRLYLNGVIPPSITGAPYSPLAQIDTSVPYMLLGDLQSGLVIDTRTKTLLQGGPGDHPEFGAGPNDTVELEGDYSAGFGLGTPDYAEQVIVHAGNDYNLIAEDNNVAAGRTLTINAMPLRAANYIIFDGSAETDGRFVFYGSDMGDVFLGGAGNDLLYGLGGGDTLSGGGGRDTFAYYDAAQSSGPAYDILADFNPTADRIDLEVSVTGFDAAVQGGTLSTASFSADLGAALAGLGAGHAMFYAPDAGDLAGNVFLVVDANGIAGYQEGEDYVFALPATTLADLAGHTDFFI
jgi:hypothetical protein